MNEIWMSVVGYEGLYEVSNKGGIRSLDRIGFTERNGSTFSVRRKGVDRKLKKDKDGYDTVNICINEKAITHKVHRLVAMAFLGLPMGREMVDHINGIKDDNRPVNLRWATPQENANYYIDMKKMCNSLSMDNKGGVMKVKSGRWSARICINSIRHCVGTFDKKEDALLEIDFTKNASIAW